jgi:hypothetical protein
MRRERLPKPGDRSYVRFVTSSDKRKRVAAAPRPTALDSADPLRNFTLSVEERIRALTIGVPAWAARKRKIEDDAARLVRDLVELHDELVAHGRSELERDRSILAAAEALDLTKLNELVATHNRYYPIEANLPMDRQSGAYLAYGRAWTPEEPYTATRLVTLTRGEIERRIEREP